MKAQVLYNLREEIGFCSGTELHEFFREQVGDPSPRGDVEIDAEAARGFVHACVDAMQWNSPKTGRDLRIFMDTHEDYIFV